MLRAQRTHKSLFNDLCKRSLIPPFSSCFYFIRTFALKAHPSDGAKVRVPEPDDKTDWIRPNFSEYFQIRKRIRQESDDQFRRSYLRKIEDATMRGMEQISLKKENSETHFDRKSTFGEDQFGDKKTFRMAKELKGMSANAIPDKTMRQIRTLLPFLDAEDEHDYVFRMNRAASAAVFRDEATRTALNEEMVTRNKLLIGKFDEHSKRLAHEAEQIKRELSKDESAIERASVQSALYKWFCLKIDFSSDELTTGAVTETEKELSGQQRKSDKTAIESDPLPFDVKGSGSGDGSEYAETKEKVFREIKELSKGNFTLEEARDLLSEESVLALVDGMRTCLNTAHDLLILKLEDDRMKEEVEKLTTEEYFKQEKRQFLEEIKNNRNLDLAISTRATFRDDSLTKIERLSRKMYETLQSQIFEQRSNYQKMKSLVKADFPYLSDLHIQFCSVSHHSPGIGLETAANIARDRKIVLKLSLNNFSSAVKANLRALFPDLIKENVIELKCEEMATKNSNKHRAMELLSKMVHEAVLLEQTGQPSSIGEYAAKLETLENSEYIKKESICSQLRKSAERAKVVKINKTKIAKLAEMALKALNKLQGEEQTRKDIEKWQKLKNLSDNDIALLSQMRTTKNFKRER